jgi:hypothetical protein
MPPAEIMDHSAPFGHAGCGEGGDPWEEKRTEFRNHAAAIKGFRTATADRDALACVIEM